MDIAPLTTEISWDSTPDSLMELATKYWEAVQPACKALEAEYFARGDLTEEERTRHALRRFRR